MKLSSFFVTLMIVSGACFSSFGQKAKMTPVQYNDYLTAITDSLYSYGTVWGEQLTAIMQNSPRDFSQLKDARQKIAGFISRKKTEVTKTPPVGKGGEGIKQSMLSFLDYEMGMINKAFIPFESTPADISDTAFQKLVTALTDQAQGEESVLKMVHAAQTAYAKENNFVLEQPKEEE